jgi:hypothetical protein
MSLTNTIIAPEVVPTTTNKVFDPGWVTQAGNGVANSGSLLYSNSTGRMLMWSFEDVSTNGNISHSYVYPILKVGTSGTTYTNHTTGWFWNSNTSNTNPEWFKSSTSVTNGLYRFRNNNGGNKWMMLPPGGSVDLGWTTSFSSSKEIIYKLTVIEEDTSLMSVRGG